METFHLILQILTLLGLAAVGLFTHRYLPAYVNKKAENLATKEDVGAITREVEEVRNAILLVTDQRIKLEDARRCALTAFFEACVDLVNEKLPVDLGDIPDRNDGLWRHLEETERAFSRLTIEGHKLALYFGRDDPLLQAAVQLLEALGRARPIFKSYFTEFRLAYVLLRDGKLRQDAARAAPNVSDDPRVHARELQHVQQRYRLQIDGARREMTEAVSRYVEEFNKHVGVDVLPPTIVS